MTKTNDEQAHKFPQFETPALRVEAEKLNSKILAIQRSKDHHKHRAQLAEFQSVLHRMRMELKRRDTEEKKLRYAVTPTQSASAFGLAL